MTIQYTRAAEWGPILRLGSLQADSVSMGVASFFDVGTHGTRRLVAPPSRYSCAAVVTINPEQIENHSRLLQNPHLALRLF